MKIPTISTFNARLFAVILICAGACAPLLAGHVIRGRLANAPGDVAYLAMLYGGRQFMVDTAQVAGGEFVFDTYYPLQSGMYLIVMPPSTSFFVLVDQHETEFRLTGDARDPEGSLQFEGSPDNAEYYAYQRFFEGKRKDLDAIKAAYDAQAGGQDRSALLARMQQLKKEVTAYQADLVARVPGTLTAAMVKCELAVEPPVFSGTPEEVNMKRYQFQKAHYFDNIDLADPRLIRTPASVLVDRVDLYLDKVTPQHPDSISASVDLVLQKCASADLTYRFFLTHIFNKYREAKAIGMDAVYVHIAEQYIATGKAPWIDEQEKAAVLAAVGKIAPTLIGKTAPDFTVQREDGSPVTLHGIQSPYTVLLFWSPDCGHCQQSMPVLKDVQARYKDKGVRMFAVCTKINEQEKDCRAYAAQQGLDAWITASDQQAGSSRVRTLYNVTTTPKIYVLDKDKKILAKDLGADHLAEVMERLMKS